MIPSLASGVLINYWIAPVAWRLEGYEREVHYSNQFVDRLYISSATLSGFSATCTNEESSDRSPSDLQNVFSLSVSESTKFGGQLVCLGWYGGDII